MTYLDIADGNFDPLDPRLFSEDLFWPTLTELREQCPVYRSERNQRVVVSRYADIVAVTQDWKTFSSKVGVPPVPFEASEGAFKLLPSEADGEYHRAIRELLNPFFTLKKAQELAPKFRSLTNELIDEFCERGECEFVADFAEKLPGLAVYEGVLGAPRDDLEKVMGWFQSILLNQEDSASAQSELLAWCRGLIESRRGGDERHDVIDAIVHGTILGRPLTELEQVQILINTTVGALETTVRALSNMVLHLATRPDLVRKLSSGESGFDRAVEEFLRYEAPAPMLGRTATCDTTMHGTEIDKGSQVLLCYSAANRDPRRFDDPDTIDFDRSDLRHLAFSRGPHVCLGQHIARLELQVALEGIIHRLQDLRLAEGGEVVYQPTVARGPERLDIRFIPSPRLGADGVGGR